MLKFVMGKAPRKKACTCGHGINIHHTKRNNTGKLTHPCNQPGCKCRDYRAEVPHTRARGEPPGCGLPLPLGPRWVWLVLCPHYGRPSCSRAFPKRADGDDAHFYSWDSPLSLNSCLPEYTLRVAECVGGPAYPPIANDRR